MFQKGIFRMSVLMTKPGCVPLPGRANDYIVCILWELHKLIICTIGPC